MAYGLIAIIDKSSGWDGHGVDGPGTAAALAHQLRYHVQASYRATSAPVIYYGPHDGLVPAGAWPISGWPPWPAPNPRGWWMNRRSAASRKSIASISKPRPSPPSASL